MRLFQWLLILARFALLAGLAAGTQCQAAQNGQDVSAAPLKHFHLFKGVEIGTNIDYAKVNGHSLKLDLFIPQKAARPVPLIVYVHGGAWMGGDKAAHEAVWLVKYGYAVASINYRLSQVALFPAQVFDCKAAVRWLRAHAAEYGIDPDRIGAWGSSAGGHLVALLGVTANRPELDGDEGNPTVSSRVRAACDFFGPTDFLSLDSKVVDQAANRAVPKLLGGPVELNREEARAASPIFYVTSNACPFLIVHGDKDPLVPVQQSIDLFNALQKAGVASKLHIVKGGGHGFKDPRAYADVLAFFNQYLK